MDRIRLNASEWMDFRSGEKKCFLLTNGLGGYCSLTVMGNAARNDQALLMGALKAPTVREHLISNVWETLEVDGEETELFSQEFVNRTQNVEGFRFLEGFEMGSLPVWFYRVKGVEIEKTIGMVQGENTVLVRYRVRSGKKGSFSVRPVMRFAAKGEQLQEGQDFAVDRNRFGVSAYGNIRLENLVLLNARYQCRRKSSGRRNALKCVTALEKWF